MSPNAILRAWRFSGCLAAAPLVVGCETDDECQDIRVFSAAEAAAEAEGFRCTFHPGGFTVAPFYDCRCPLKSRVTGPD